MRAVTYAQGHLMRLPRRRDRCRRCRRPLRDPDSMQRGYGPLCWRRKTHLVGPLPRRRWVATVPTPATPPVEQLDLFDTPEPLEVPAMADVAAPIGDGLTRRQLDHWVRVGYLRPDNAAPGSGYARQWTAGECRVARTMARLIAAGITVQAAHDIARAGTPRVELAPGVVVELDAGQAAP